MIQFNLLPDVKLQYIKATYRRRVIAAACFVVGGTFLFIFIMMFLFVKVNQPRVLDNLDTDIQKGVAQLRENPDLDKILTVQSQLSSLPALHEQKVMGSRIFDYLGQVTPANVSVTNVEIDFEAKTVSVKGTADNLTSVNTLVDTLKFTEYSMEGEEQPEGAEKPKAFSSVVLQSFDLGSATQGTSEKQASYQVVFTYDETIFKNTAKEGSAVANTVQLSVPSIISTRSEIQRPDTLFQNEPTAEPAPEATN